MSARTQSILAGLAAVAALVSYLAVQHPPSDAPGGHYDERGHWVVPISPDLEKRLHRPEVPRHPRETAILEEVDRRLLAVPTQGRAELLGSVAAGSRHVWTTFWVEAEVKNGGFDQYFANGNEVFARRAIEGFRALGGEKYAVLVEKAIAIHESPSASDKGRDLRYDPVDEAFFKLDDELPVASLRAKYIDAHPEEFPK